MSEITTTITDPTAIESYNRGPLTTSFTPPSTCLSTMTYYGGQMYFGHAGGNFYDSACYPSSRSSTYTVLADNGDWNQYYYSPGQCPIGWYHATTFTSFFTNAADVPGTILFPLGSDTSAVLCCPTGYSLFGQAGHQCATTIDSIGAELLYVAPGLSNTILVAGSAGTSTITESPYVYWGDGIPIWWQSSDLEAFTAPPKTTSSTISQPTNTETQISATSGINPPSTPSSGSGGLSTGAKAAIGVTIPVVVIAVILGIFFYFRRRGMRRLAKEPPGYGEIKSPNGRGELTTDGALSELENHPRQEQHYELADR